MNARLEEIRQERIKKLQQWRQFGVDPFPPRTPPREPNRKKQEKRGRKSECLRAD